MANSQQPAAPLYIFLDESGDLDFSPSGSKFFLMTCVAVRRPFPWEYKLAELRFDLIESGRDIEYFHATEDKQPVRDKVFGEIQTVLGAIRADSIIVEKRKTGPALQATLAFYPRVLGYLIRFVVSGLALSTVSDIIIITDELPINKKRKAVVKAIKSELATMLPAQVPYKIFHHSSKSCSGLQIADYLSWAVFRKWTINDTRSHSLVSQCIKSEFDIFRTGVRHYY